MGEQNGPTVFGLDGSCRVKGEPAIVISECPVDAESVRADDARWSAQQTLRDRLAWRGPGDDRSATHRIPSQFRSGSTVETGWRAYLEGLASEQQVNSPRNNGVELLEAVG